MSTRATVTEPTYQARKHDRAVIAHLLARPFSGVFGDPGTGKTGHVLAAYHVLRQKRLIDYLFVVGPINAIYEAWPDQLVKWRFPYQITVLHGPKKDRLIGETDTDIYAVNFDGLPWFNTVARQLLEKGERWWLVGDESHNLKDTSTQRFKALKPWLPCFGRRTVLTATPRPQGLEDLFGQAYLVDQGEAFGRYITHYRREYFYPSGYGGYTWAPQEGAEQRIYAKLAGAFIHIDERVLDLPPIHDVPRFVHLDDDTRAMYKRLEDEFILELKSGTVTAVNAGVKSGKLRQLANGFVYWEDEKSDKRKTTLVHSAKVDSIVELVDGLGGSPLLVGYEFIADGARLSKALGGAPIVGDVPPKQRKALFAEFNHGKLPALLAQTGAASESLNLQEACHHVALFGLPWKTKDYIQFRGRVHRAGQKHRVTVHHVIARHTIDDRVMWPMLERRRAEQADFFKFLQKAYNR